MSVHAKKKNIFQEFIGRFPVLVPFQKLDVNLLVRILDEPKNSVIEQYIELLRMDMVDLTFDRDALAYIANSAIEQQTGARGLKAILVRFFFH